MRQSLVGRQLEERVCGAEAEAEAEAGLCAPRELAL